ncbi:MAG: hypothetical protein WC480_01195 [Patescibacteria group bacterium]
MPAEDNKVRKQKSNKVTGLANGRRKSKISPVLVKTKIKTKPSVKTRLVQPAPVALVTLNKSSLSNISTRLDKKKITIYHWPVVVAFVAFVFVITSLVISISLSNSQQLTGTKLIIEETASLDTGILTVVADCQSDSGCGPKYKLWSPDFKNFVPLVGDISDQDNGLLIRVVGQIVELPAVEYDPASYRGSTQAWQVTSYQVLDKISYRDFLVQKSREYTNKNYLCFLMPGRQGSFSQGMQTIFGWALVDNQPILKVRMTDIYSVDDPQPYYELWYDGNSGELVKEIFSPVDGNFCN